MLFLWQFAVALPEFSLTVTKTDESCLGNGTLSFSVTGSDPGATIVYKIYQLPDAVNPIAVQSDPTLGGRTAGTYRVVATQSMGGEFNSQTREVTINNVIVPLAYEITSTHTLCGPDAKITVVPVSGNAVLFEIISGPVTRPLQPSPVFDLVPAGIYEVRVFDNCGVGWVVTHTVISDGASLTVGVVGFPDAELPSCNTVNVVNIVTASNNSVLSYPLSVEYTIHPPGGGAPVTIVKSQGSGEESSAEVKTEIPLFYDQEYSFDIKVTDNCGNSFTRTDNLVKIKLEALLSAEQAKCGQKYLSIRAFNYRPAIIVQWLDAPSGFDPAAFNAAHPGPFSELPITYGDYETPVPWGFYKVKITDGCGRTAVAEIELEYEEPDPVADIDPYDGCESNKSLVMVQIPGFTIVTAIITAAPAAYPNAVPDDVTHQITEEDGVVLDYLITGNYTIHLVDDCGNEYDFDFFVPDTATSTTQLARPDCEFGKGGVRIRGYSTTLTSVLMISAPDEFNQTMPYDVSFNIANGNFSMAGLPPGTYVFTVVDSCGLSHEITLTVVGYAESQNDFSLTPHCGSFDFVLNYTSTASAFETFWLQRFNTATGLWEHPQTGVPYTEGAVPTSVNSLEVTNNSNNLNLTFTGQFRIVKRYQSFDNGSVGEFKECIKVIREFEFTGNFKIVGFEKITCNGALADIKVLTDGVPPLIYKIIEKNGQPFSVDNGNNNVFTNLEQAVYKFWVQHACGHVQTGIADVAQLPSLANATQPANLEKCDDASNDQQETFDLTTQNAAILGGQNPADFTLTYHATLADATTGTNPLPATLTSGNTTIYARLKYNGSTSDCFDLVQFDLIVHPYPAVAMEQIWPMCEGGSVTITAPPGFDSYQWSSGQHTQSITVSQSGQYILTVTQGNCQGDFPVDVVVASTPVIQHIETSDWTQNDNSITVILEGGNASGYLYSLDGVNYQSSSAFTNLPPGAYTVYVKNAIGECGVVPQEVFLLTYPRFFTPNGDGFNDFWKVKFSEREPHLMTYVFDRYGKLITGFLPDSAGWDGKLNGQPLPSTDYWFLVVREDGKEFRGHFAMKR